MNHRCLPNSEDSFDKQILMPNNAKTPILVKNRLLAALPPEEFELFRKYLKAVSFEPGDVLFHTNDSIRRVYFPSDGMISLLSVTQSGQTVEIGYVAREGMVGVPLILGRTEMPYQATAQTHSSGFSMEAKDLIEYFQRYKSFNAALLRYVSILLKQLAQSGVCNNFHTIEARLCRWMMVMLDNSDSDVLMLTQEFIAYILGVQRTSVGMIAGNLQSAGIIRYRRGRIEIIDREKLAAAACECYRVIKNEYDSFLK